jgi:hypothetical protein
MIWRYEDKTSSKYKLQPNVPKYITHLSRSAECGMNLRQIVFPDSDTVKEVSRYCNWLLSTLIL